jgi:hypothetical protein
LRGEKIQKLDLYQAWEHDRLTVAPDVGILNQYTKIGMRKDPVPESLASPACPSPLQILCWGRQGIFSLFFSWIYVLFLRVNLRERGEVVGQATPKEKEGK